MTWHLLRSKPRNELRAVANAQGQGISLSCPMISVKANRRGQISTRLEPLFKGYLFAAIANDDDYHALRFTRGVIDFVRFGTKPVQVPEVLVEEIFRRCAAPDNTIDTLPAKGDRVALATGPLAGLEILFQSNSGDERAVVLVEMLSQWHEVEVDLRNLIKQ